MIVPFDFHPRTRLIFGTGTLAQSGTVAAELGFRRTLLVADPGLAAVGYVERATELLRSEGIVVIPFHDFAANPDTAMVERGRLFAATQGIDSIVALGGGSSMDCAKGINLVLTNGGDMHDYWGYGKASRALLPMIGIPTTAGTGSEAQSYALISDVETHAKMACGDPKAAFRVAILDPELTVSQPQTVTALAGYDALSHAVESYVSTKCTTLSESFSREAWRLLESNYERVLANPRDLESRAAMQLGACYGGLAIENSMLGAAHACANPLTARYGTEHGRAIALLLPTVVRWNATSASERYRELLQVSGLDASQADAAEVLAQRLESLAAAASLETRLELAGVPLGDLRGLAEEASKQWTGRFNPRPFGIEEAMEVYEWAF
jgi:alcohol dehydrogenase class IV